VFSQLFLLYGAAFLGHAVFLVSCLGVCAIFGVKVLEARLGTPQLFRRGVWSVGALPISGSALFAHSHDRPGGDASADAFDQKPRLVRVAISLSGCAGLLLAALLLRGPDALQSFINAFGQIFGAVMAPPTRGSELISGYFRIADEQGIRMALAVLFAKVAAFNLLPIPFLAGARAIQELLRGPGQTPPPPARASGLQYLGLALLLVNLGAWLWAMIVALG